MCPLDILSQLLQWIFIQSKRKFKVSDFHSAIQKDRRHGQVISDWHISKNPWCDCPGEEKLKQCATGQRARASGDESGSLCNDVVQKLDLGLCASSKDWSAGDMKEPMTSAPLLHPPDVYDLTSGQQPSLSSLSSCNA